MTGSKNALKQIDFLMISLTLGLFLVDPISTFSQMIPRERIAAKEKREVWLEIDDKNNEVRQVPAQQRSNKKMSSDGVPTPATLPEHCQQLTFDASQSYDPDNNDLKFSWNFGDGQTSNQPIIQHVYKEPGEYTVTLSVSDDRSTSETTQKINIHIPPEADFAYPTEACVKEELSFSAFSSQVDLENYTLTWDFGDGTTQTGGQVTKDYSQGGDYTVRLTVDDQSASSCGYSTIEKTIHINEPPAAVAGQDVIQMCLNQSENLKITFDASNSSDINNDELSYLWDFGDGATAQGQVASHQYAQGGQYEVQLKVSDNSSLGCSTDKDTLSVILTREPKADPGEDVSTCVGDEVTFDGTKSYVDPNDILMARWEFGDGQFERGLKVLHTYQKPGHYVSTLTVQNAHNPNCPESSKRRMVTINSYPVVSFEAEERTCVGDTVMFNASQSRDPDGDPLELTWDFGDGTTLTGGPRVSHTYKKGGTYSVVLTADDQQVSGCSRASFSQNIRVNTPPVANAGENQTCCTDKETLFDGSQSQDPDGDPLNYYWDFGDGSTSEQMTTRHTYQKSGSYPVYLLVIDDSNTHCNSSLAGFSASINQKPVPVIQIR